MYVHKCEYIAQVYVYIHIYKHIRIHRYTLCSGTLIYKKTERILVIQCIGENVSIEIKYPGCMYTYYVCVYFTGF